MPIPSVLARRLVLWIPIATASLLAGCGGGRNPNGQPDAGLDAGNVGDGGDAGDVDANLPMDDGGALDGGDLDAGDVGDAGDVDASATDAGDLDGGTIDGGSADGGTPASVVSPAADVVRLGTAGLLLRGAVLTPTAVLDPGEVLVVGNAITCVAVDCSATAGAATATIVDTHGIISPGLIDSHNHLAYDFLGEWVAPRIYDNRYQWAANVDYEAFIAPYGDMRSTGAVYCPAAKWGELRSMVHGTTTVLGSSFQQGCVNVFVRNADHYDGIGGDQLTTYIGSPRDVTDTAAAGYVTRFTDVADPLTRFAVHMAEGVRLNNVELEFGSFAGRDTRANRHMGTSLLSGTGYVGTGVLIHSVPLTTAELMEAADTQSKMVWSPSSNMVLYGATADIGAWLALGLTIGLGPDWTVSGEDDMLAELRFARDYGRTVGVAGLSAQRLWEMATIDGAEVVGLSPTIGRLEVGARADITVIGRTGGDPYDAVIDADARDVRLTIIDGEAYYGDLALETATSVNGDCDNFDACGTPKFLCVQNVPQTQAGTVNRTAETLDDVQMQLLTLLAGYGRSDLLPLASECVP